MAEKSQETESQRHKTGNIRKDQVTQRPEIRKDDVYKPYQGNVNPSNGIASQPKPNIEDTRMLESGPGPPSSTKLVPGATKPTLTLPGQVPELSPKLPQSLTEPEPRPHQSGSQGIKSLPTIEKPGTKPHLESSPTLPESPPTLPESHIEPTKSTPIFSKSEIKTPKSPLPESEPELTESAKIHVHYLENKTFNIKPAMPSWDSYQTQRCYSSPHSFSPYYTRGMNILSNNAVTMNAEYLTTASQSTSQLHMGGISNTQSIDNCIVYKSSLVLESGERFPEKFIYKYMYDGFKPQDIDIKEATTDTE